MIYRKRNGDTRPLTDGEIAEMKKFIDEMEKQGLLIRVRGINGTPDRYDLTEAGRKAMECENDD